MIGTKLAICLGILAFGTCGNFAMAADSPNPANTTDITVQVMDEYNARPEMDGTVPAEQIDGQNAVVDDADTMLPPPGPGHGGPGHGGPGHGGPGHGGPGHGGPGHGGPGHGPGHFPGHRGPRGPHHGPGFPIPFPRARTVCFARNDMGSVFRAYGYGFARSIQNAAMRTCERYSRHPRSCRPLGCR
jgi:hypothetical protein